MSYSLPASIEETMSDRPIAMTFTMEWQTTGSASRGSIYRSISRQTSWRLITINQELTVI